MISQRLSRLGRFCFALGLGVWSGGLAWGGGSYEILVNPGFDQMLSGSTTDPLGWTSNEGFVPALGGCCGSQGDSAPAVSNGNLQFGNSSSVVVSQEVSVSGVVPQSSEFYLGFGVQKNQMEGQYWVLAEFIDANGAGLATLRYPATGTAVAPSSLTAQSLSLSRSGLAQFNNIKKVRVSLFGKQTAYTWYGHYGPTFSHVSLVASQVAPAEVSGLVATGGDASVVLKWPAPPSTSTVPSDYIIEYSANGGSSWLTFQDAVSTALSATVSGLVNGTTYQFRVSAVNSVGTSAPSNIATARASSAPQFAAQVWRELYATTTPIRNTSGMIVYSVDNSQTLSGVSFQQVRYSMEAQVDNTWQYVNASFDAWSGLTVGALRFPSVDVPTIQRNVSNLSVESNVSAVTAGSGLTGRLEIWPYNYSPTAVDIASTSGSSAVYDLDDTMSNDGSYGSFQVHDLTSKKLVFAWNNHGNPNPDIGFGNNPYSQYTDWTFYGSNYGLDRASWRLSVSIGVTGIPDSWTVTEDVSSNLALYGSPLVDAENDVLTLTVSVPDGTLTAAPSSPVTVSGSATATVLVGNAADLNTYLTTLGNLKYQPPQNDTQSRTATLTVSDGNLSASRTVTIQVTPVNDAPSLSLGFFGQGGVKTSAGEYAVHTFTSSSDTFMPSESGLVEVLLVGGGGGGGGSFAGGGGGGGGVVSSTSYAVNAGEPISVIVGLGGAGGSFSLQGKNGGDSHFGSLTAKGGGGGGTYPENKSGQVGGSGGGAGYAGVPGAGQVGQGSLGGEFGALPRNHGGGGGGAGGTPDSSGIGGVGVVSSISGLASYYAGGGAAGTDDSVPLAGGLGGGGVGGQGFVNGFSGAANSGGGGGGGGGLSIAPVGGAGGSGVVIVRYSSTVSDQTTLEDTVTGSIAFTVGDVETAATALTVTATSSNLGVVAAGGIALGGNGANRTITLTPVANASGTSTITVTVTDADGASATGSFTLTVTAVNDLPTISAISGQTTLEDTATGSIAFTVGDVETAATALTVTATSSNLGVVAAGGIALGGSGANRTMTLTPVANASGTSTITVTVTDADGASATRSFVVTVIAVNDAPTVIAPARVVMTEDNAGNLTFTGTPFADIDSSILTVTLSVSDGTITGDVGTGITVSGTATARIFSGTVSDLNTYFTTAGNITYQGALNNTENRVLTTTVSDGNLSASIASTITLTAVNDAPLLSASQGSMQAIEQVAVAVDGEITVSDVDNETLASATVAVSGGYQSGEDVLGYVSNPQAHGNISGSFNASTGVLTLTSVGTTATLAQWQEALRSVTYLNTSDVPNTSARTVTVAVNDGALTSPVVTKTVSVSSVNDAPSLAGITVNGAEDTTYTFTASTFTGSVYSDLENSALVSLRVETLPTSGTLKLSGTPVTAGQVIITADLANLSYMPAANENGSKTFTVTVSDGLSSSSTATVAITLVPVNDAPVASGTATLDSIQEDGAGSSVGQTIQNLFSANFSDAADDNQGALAAIAISAHAIDATRGVWQYSTDGQNWIAVPASSLSSAFLLNASDRLRFVPIANYNGLATPLEARLIESGGSALTTGTSINLSSNGPQVSLTRSSVIGWSSMYSTSFSPDRVLDNQSGSVLKDIFGNNYWLALDQTVTGYFVIDLGAPTDLSRVELYNTSNTGYNDRGTVNFHIEVASSISGNGAASYALVNPKTAVSGTLIPAVVGVNPVAQSFSLQTDEVIPRYVRFVVDSSRNNNPGLNEIRLFAKSELAGGASRYSTAAVTLLHAIAAVNDAPVATAQTVTTEEDTAKTITLAGTDVEGSVLTYSVVTQPTKGVLSGTLPNLTYTPNANVNGSDSFTFKVNDGALDSGVATVSVSIVAMNDSPTLGTPNAISLLDTVASDSFTELMGTFSGTDVDSATLVYGISNGTVFDGVASKVGAYGTLTVTASTGAYTFTPNASAINALISEASESYTVTVSDNGGLSATANIGVSITGVNDAPLLSASQGPTQATEQVAVAVDSGITVSDADNVTLASATVAVSGGYQSGEDVLGYVNNPQAHGNISGSFNASTGLLTLTSVGTTATLAQWQEALRSVTYLNTSDVPNTSARTVTVAVNDGALTSPVVTKTVSVSSVNDAPSLAGITVNGTEDTTYTFTASTFTGSVYSDLENSALVSLRVETLPTSGTLKLSGTPVTAGQVIITADLANLSYMPAANENGPKTFTVTVSDGLSSSSTATVTISLVSVNDAPTLTSGSTMTYLEKGAGVPIDPALTVADVDDVSLTSATVSIESPVTGDLLSLGNQDGINAAYDATTGILSLTGSAPLSVYQAALRSVVYSSSSSNPNLGGTRLTRTIRWSVTDANGSKASNGALASIAGDAGTTYLENTVYTLSSNGSNPYIIPMDLGQNWIFEAEYRAIQLSNGGLNTLFSYGKYTDGILMRTLRGDALYLKGFNFGNINVFGGETTGEAFVPVKIQYSTSGNTGTLRVEANGVLIKSVTGAAPLNPADKTIRLGSAHHANSEGFNGQVRNIKITQGSAVNSTQSNISITSVNDAPTLTSVSVLTGGREDTALTISHAMLSAAANAADVDGDSLSFRIESVSSGTLTKDGTAVSAGTAILASSESLVWTPAADAYGILEAFTVKAWDGQLDSTTAVPVTVSVGSVSDGQTVSFADVGSVIYGVGSVPLTASASSGLPVTLEVVSGPGRISGSSLEILGAGSVVVRASQAGDGIWDPASPVQRSVTVAKKELTVTNPIAATKAYDGTTSAVITGTLSGVMNGDDVKLVGTGTFASKNVGSGQVVTSTSTWIGLAAGNYTLTQPTGLTATISAKALSINGLSGVTKVYDGTTAATVSGTAALSGMVSGDEGQVILSGTPVFTFASAHVGKGIAISTSGYSVSGPQAGNYTLSEPTISADITTDGLLGGQLIAFSQSSVSIPANNEITINQSSQLPPGAVVERVVFTFEYSTYWSSSAVAGNYVKLNGIDLPGLGWTSVGTGNAWKAVTTTYLGSLSAFNRSGANSWLIGSAWNPVSLRNATMTIHYWLPSKLSQTLNFEPLADVTYGAQDLSLTASASSGLPVSWEVASGPGQITGSSLKVLGVGSIVVRASQTGDSVWFAAQPLERTMVVAKKALSVGEATVVTKAYDGTTAAGAVTVGTLTGLVGSETLTVTGTAAAYSSAAVGTYDNVAVTYTLADGGSGNTAGLASNYTLAAGSASGTITPAALLITADPSSLIQDYDGKSHAILWRTQPAGISVEVLYNGSPTAPQAAGIYEVELSSLDSNFSGTLTVTLTVRKQVQGIALIGGVVAAGLQSVTDPSARYLLEATLGQPIAGSMVVVSGIQLSSGFWFTDRWDQALNLGDVPIPTAEVADQGIATRQTSAQQSSSSSTSETRIPQVASGLRLTETRMTVVPIPYLLRVRIQISGIPGARWKVQSLDGLHSENWQDADLLELDSNGTGSIETDAGTDSGMRFYRLVQP